MTPNDIDEISLPDGGTLFRSKHARQWALLQPNNTVPLLLMGSGTGGLIDAILTAGLQARQKRKWSSDNCGIGYSSGGSPLDIRVIPRPPGLTLAEWSLHAKRIIDVLNEAAE